MWPGFKSPRRRHVWVEFVVGSLLCSERFSPGTPVFPSPQKPTEISKFQFDQELGRRRTTLWMCYLQIIIYLCKDLSDIWLSTLEIGAAQLRTVTERSLKSPFLCLNRSHKSGVVFSSCRRKSYSVQCERANSPQGRRFLLAREPTLKVTIFTLTNLPPSY